MDLLPVAGGVRGDFGRLLAIATGPLKILANLLASRAGSVEVFLCIALDLRRAASTDGDLVAELPQSVSQFGLIDGGGELLGCEEALRLNGARLAIFTFGDIEDDRMSMQLWGDIPVRRASCVM